MDRIIIRIAALVAITCGASLAERHTATAQVFTPDGRFIAGDEESAQSRRLFVTDRELSQRMRQASELLKAEKYAAAVARLQFVLDRPEDVFYQPDPEDASHFLSLKSEAQRLLGSLPADGRRVYEAQYAEPARRMLDEAIAAGDVKALEEVVRRFFHTEAGYEAMYLMATSHLDRGEPLAAALHFERLRKVPAAVRRWEPLLSLKAAVGWGRAGLPEQGVRTLIALKDAHGGRDLTLGGKTVAFFRNEADALPWLARTLQHDASWGSVGSGDWTVFRGNAARNAVPKSAAPIWQVAWTASTALPDDPGDTPPARFLDAARETNKLQSRFRQSGDFLTLPAAAPIVAGNAVVFRTPRNVRAVDLDTGGVLWESFDADEAFYEIVENGLTVPSPRQNPLGIPQLPAREALLAQRAWRDLTYGTISSDGRYVFSLEKLSFLGPFQNYGRGAVNHPLAPTDENRLVAYELRSGKMKWQVDGARRDADAIAPGAFFLGPPMPLGEQLYCLAEAGGEIRLVVLEVHAKESDDRTGVPGLPQPRIAWEQRLIYPQEDISRNPLRRMAGLSPAYDDGILVCPTMAGAVVAVDVSRRMLLWGYHYETPERETIANNRQAMLMAQMRRNGYGLIDFDDSERWVDSVPIIAEGHVLLTPRDSNELHCLSLVDGTVRWKKPRGQGLFVAAACGGHVIVAGRTHLEAWRLADGEAAWKTPAPTGMPSGRGVAVEDRYHLPLDTGEVVSVRLSDGQVLGRSRTPEGRSAGNLIAAQGRLIWQTIDAVVALESVAAVAERVASGLEQNPEDAELLTLRGELRLHEGDEQGALADLKAAARIDSAGRARQVLASTFMELLRSDFGKYRHNVEEIESLVQDPRLRLEYLRMHAAGLERLGETRQAFDAWLRLADLETLLPGDDRDREPMVKVDTSRAVRRDRWAAARVRSLFEAAAERDEKHMTAALQARLNAAIEAEDVPALRELPLLLGDRPEADTARRHLAELWDKNLHAAEIELHLGELRRSSRTESAAWATARLVQLFVANGRAAAARPLVEDLRTRWADVECFDGLTGRALVEQWKAEKAFAQQVRTEPEWGREPFRAQAGRRYANAETRFPVELHEPSGPYADRRILVDQQRRFLAAYDHHGRELWKLTLAGSNPNGTVFFTGGYARALGHLLFIALDEDLLVLDTLTAGDTPKVLWKQRLFDVPLDLPGDANAARLFLGGRAPMARNRAQEPMTDRYGRPMGRLGPVTEDVVCYQVGARVIAAEPLTGRTLWERDYIERGSDLFGDDEHLVIVPSGSREAIVLRLRDGHELARPELPAAEHIRTTLGTTLITWQRRGDTTVLRRVQVFGEPKSGEQRPAAQRPETAADRTLWEQSFAAGAQVDFSQDAVAVLEPDGRLRVLSLTDGNVLVDEKLAAEPGVRNVYLRRGLAQWLVLSYNPARDAPPGPQFAAAAAAQGQPVVNGAVHGFDLETGRRAWTRPLERPYLLDPGQPQNSPVLVLASRGQERALPRGPRRAGDLFNQNQFSLAVIDTRTGELIHEETGPHQSVPFEVVLKPEERRIDVLTSQLEVSLRQDSADGADETPAEP